MQFTVIQRNLAAWIASTALEGLTGTAIGILMDSRCRVAAALRNYSPARLSSTLPLRIFLSCFDQVLQEPSSFPA